MARKRKQLEGGAACPKCVKAGERHEGRITAHTGAGRVRMCPACGVTWVERVARRRGKWCGPCERVARMTAETPSARTWHCEKCGHTWVEQVPHRQYTLFDEAV